MKTFGYLIGAGVLGLAACAPVQDGGGTVPPMDDTADQCMAAQYQSLIGQNRSQIPAQPAGATWRVTCTTCPVTMDFNPRRLNIFYDERTGVVREVRCG